MRMQIELSEGEVTAAIREYAIRKEPLLDGKELKITVYTNIGEQDFTADIEVENET